MKHNPSWMQSKTTTSTFIQEFLDSYINVREVLDAEDFEVLNIVEGED